MYKFLPLILIVFLGCHSKTEGLRFNFQKGKVYEYETSYQVEQQEDQTSSKLSNHYSVEVLDEKDGIKTLKITYIDFSAAIDNEKKIPDSVDVKDSSSLSIQDIMNSVYSSLKGKSFQMKVNSYGKVTEVIGLGELLVKVVDTMKLPATGKMMAKQMFTSKMGSEMLARPFSYGFDMFPNKEVKVGDTWEKDMGLNGMIPISAKTVFTVKEISGNNITLDAKSILSNDKRKGEVISTFIVDSRSGLILNADIQSKFGNPAEVTGNGKITGREK